VKPSTMQQTLEVLALMMPECCFSVAIAVVSSSPIRIGATVDSIWLYDNI
jgi:hypothetical protein